MKILEIIETLAPGGGERFVVDLSNQLSNSEEVYIATLRNKPNSEFYRDELNAKIKLVPCSGTTSLPSKIWQLVLIIKLIVKVRPEIVHAHLVAFNYIIIPSLLFRKIRFFYTVHNLAEKDTGTGLIYKLKKWIFKDLIKPITISNECEKSFQSFFGYSSYCMIENGCRPISKSKLFQSAEREVDNYKDNVNTKVFINVARLMEQKNHQLLVEAFERLSRRENNAILLIIGDYQNNPVIKDKLNNSISTKKIFFLGTKHNVVDYLSVSDYFCLSSKWEGLPISLLEAGLSGVFPICTPVGGIPDVILDESWGMLTEDMEVESYLKCLESAMAMKYEKSEIQKRYESRYLIDKCANSYISRFKAAI